MVKSPCARQQIMTELDCPVIEPFNRSPFRVTAIVKKNLGMLGMRIAAEYDDTQRFSVYVVLQLGDLEVIVFNHMSDYHCFAFWAERAIKRTCQYPFTARQRVTATP